jgi:1-acyl-sn-glycerol-3-phosphate acyltransferase
VKLEQASKVSRPLRHRTLRLRFTRALSRVIGNFLFVQLLVKATLHGMENIPREGPTIIVFNHLTIIEPMMIACMIPFRTIVPIGKRELMSNPFFAIVCWGFGAILIRRGEVEMEPLKRSMEVLQAGDVMMMAPEGHRQKELRDPKEGMVLLASRTGAMIVPIGVSGTQNAGKSWKKLQRPEVTIEIGKPIRIKPGLSRKQYGQSADEVMYQIARMIDPNLRGEYADLSQAKMDTIEFA